MLTATLTRPTTISPTNFCDTKVNLIEAVDIAPIPEPKPRIISLEPISRRARAKRKRPETAVADAVPQSPRVSEAPRKPQTLEANGTADYAEGPRSPSPSDVSYESQMSSGGASGTEYGIRSVNTTTEGSAPVDGSRPKGKTITATIDVLKGGFLRGDQIPIKVMVEHTKHVRSLNGIIVTLYRQARVDMHPALPVAPNSKGDKKKTEDYYPKSLTGLGGLSLSSAGSSHVFRKDLSQSFAPLFVDPRTLLAEVKCAVRVPDEAFPTISNVPGAMISFKYYIEVIVDIQGKLTGLDRMVANAGGLVNVPSASRGPGMDDAAGSVFSGWGGNFVDTDQIRREKGVISALFEVIIGTKDSDRNGKRKQTRAQEAPHNVHDISFEAGGEPIMAEGYNEDYYDYDENGQYYDYNYDPSYYEVPGYEQHGHGRHPSYHAPPLPADGEGELTEKERIRRAEARLLPSQPPDISGSSSSPSGAIQQGVAPSAPLLPEDDDPNLAYPVAGPSSLIPAHPPPPFRTASTPMFSSHTNMAPPLQRRATNHMDDDNRTARTGSSSTINATHHRVGAPSTVSRSEHDQSKALPPLPPQPPADAPGPAPNYSPPAATHVQPTDDKQEMQRRRLELEASAPPDERDEDGEPSHRPSAPPIGLTQVSTLQPSAPMLDDEDEGLVDAVRRGRNAAPSAPPSDERTHRESLPGYQR
jgi:hypothetical protein